MPIDGEILCLDSPRFRAMSEAMLSGGSAIRFKAHGLSMQPNILDGDVVMVAPVLLAALRVGEVVLTAADGAMKLHRITSMDGERGRIITRGDASCEDDFPTEKVLGRVVEIERAGRRIAFGRFRMAQHRANRLARRLSLALAIRARKLFSVSTVVNHLIAAIRP